MNILKSKVFITLFLLLTLFLFIILFIFNYINYNGEVKKVKDRLIMMNDRKSPDDNFRFIDADIYTVIINDNKILSVTSHNMGEDNDEIKKIAEGILKKGIKDIYIGNLYFEKYSYSIFQNKMTISDNEEINEELRDYLLKSLLVFIFSEVVILFVTINLTKWITHPAEEALKKQKEFIADASHELKTPLAVIMASEEALERDNNKKWLDNIKEEANRMNKLILSLLDQARFENTKVEKEATNLSKLVLKSILTFESIIYEKNINLDYDIKDDIVFNCNEDSIKQLLSILIDNAVKHTKEEIKVNLFKGRSGIVLEVINKGKPILKEDEEKIFERFYRVDKSRNRDDNRYGLGLSIAKSIVTNHNGTIKAYSKDGFTIFKVVFKK